MNIVMRLTSVGRPSVRDTTVWSRLAMASRRTGERSMNAARTMRIASGDEEEHEDAVLGRQLGPEDRERANVERLPTRAVREAVPLGDDDDDDALQPERADGEVEVLRSLHDQREDERRRARHTITRGDRAEDEGMVGVVRCPCRRVRAEAEHRRLAERELPREAEDEVEAEDDDARRSASR